ncbi:hypothetical protein [Pandoraea sp. CB10b_02]|uniref:hypothetical protein n=1 Tax=Pandoraea sp. CB10b_02 TaxID=2014535 RepID=UPI002580677C|nr:hypothetical protein [Pandoraea sp. CB10b_02]
MRLDPASTTSAPFVPAAQAAPDAHDVPDARDARDAARVTLDFPVAPDEVRLHSRTASRLARAGCAAGLAGVACTVLGIASFAGGAYLCLDAASDVADGAPGREPWAAYAVGGTLVGMAAISISIGLHQVGACLRKRREAAEHMRLLSLSAHYAPLGGRAHDPA